MHDFSLKKWLVGLYGDLSEMYLVGGAVRDIVMGLAPKDIDIICKGAKRFASTLASSRNAALVALEKKPHQPCFRVVEREDPNQYLDIAEMRGESVHEDLIHRDFTINSMAMEIGRDFLTGRLIDPLGAMEDIKKRRVRMVSPGSMTDDPLRLLRAVRFSAVLGFYIEEATLSEIRLRASLLRGVSAERIMNEVNQILGHPDSSSYIRLMDDLGLLEIIFPEITPMKGCLQNGYHHLDVWGHSMLALENIEKILNNPKSYFKDSSDDIIMTISGGNRLPLLKLAVLLHDSGKPPVREVAPDTGRVHFYGHDKEGAAITEAAAHRMKMSSDEVKYLTALVSEHMNILALASQKTRSSTRMRWFRRMRDDSVPALILSMADVMSSLGPDSDDSYRVNHTDWTARGIIDYVSGIREKIDIKPLITGHDLISLGMSPGPLMGKVLRMVRDAQDSSIVKTHQQALDLARNIIDQAN